MTNDKQYPDPPVALRHIYKFADPLSGELIWRPEATTWNGQAAQASIGLYTLAQMKEFADATCAMRAREPASVEGPSEEEITHLMIKRGWKYMDDEERADIVSFAHEVLSKWGYAPTTQTPQPQEATPSSNAFVQRLLDKCDRIVWRGHYYQLPIKAAPSQDAEVASPKDKPDHRTSSDQAAAVTDEFRWLPIDNGAPRGCRLMLINKHAGIATIGILPTQHVFWTHWAPLPTFKK